MANHNLAIYLNDHLAGSTVALEILAELRRADGFEEWADRIRSEIEEDRDELERVMRKADIAQSTVRRAAAYLTEKVAEIKTRLEDRKGGALQRLELMEALSLGIEGKRALWTALNAAAHAENAFGDLNFTRLIQRAEDQRRAVEVRRLQAAADALHSVAA